MANQLFSPFVSRVKPISRRQSRLPPDLIDWDAPEMPEIERQRIVYEDIIEEIKEDHVIDQLIGEHIISLVYDVHLEGQEQKHKLELSEQKQKQQLLLSQHAKLIQDNQALSVELEETTKLLEERDLASKEKEQKQEQETFKQLQQMQQMREQELEEKDREIEELKSLLDEKTKALEESQKNSEVFKTHKKQLVYLRKYRRDSEDLRNSILESIGLLGDDELSPFLMELRQKLEQFDDS